MKNRILFLSLLGCVSLFILFAFRLNTDTKIIVIDAGHGGDDAGVSVDGKLEKEIVEDIANKINELNENPDIEIVLLRKGDSFISLNDRIARIADINPDLVISLHINTSDNPSENGVNAYVSKQNPNYDSSVEKAKVLLDKLTATNLNKGAITDANFRLLKNIDCPAVLLEIGYLTNMNDNAFVSSEVGQNAIAEEILETLKD